MTTARSTMWRRGTAATLMAVAVIGGSGSAAAQADGREGDAYSWSGDIRPGGALEIRGVTGSIRVERAAGGTTEVRATLSGRRSDPGTVRIERIEHGGGVTFCAVYPTPDGEEPNECGPGGDGRMSTGRNDVRVDFVARVPDGVALVARNVSGDVEANDLRGDVDVATVNGDVSVSTDGAARARTVNGSIQVTMGAQPTNDVHFETVNGSISLALPESLDAELDARWVNGGLESELPIRMSGRFGRRSARGVLGSGGPTVTLKTVNGSIRLRGLR